VTQPTYFSTIARRASGTVPVIAPSPVPMRGWQGAWPGELPAATVVQAAAARHAAPRLPTEDAAGHVVRDPGIAARASQRERAEPAPASGGPAAITRRADTAAPANHEAVVVRGEQAPVRRVDPTAGTPARLPPLARRATAHEGVADPEHERHPAHSHPVLDDNRPAVAAVSPGLSPAAAAVSPGLSPAAAAVSPGLSPAAGPVSPRLSPAAALEAAFRWVSAGPAIPAAREAIDVESHQLEPRGRAPARDARDAGEARRPLATPAPAAVAPVPVGKPAPRAIHIGSIQVAIQPPPDGGPPGPSRPGAAAAPSSPLSRGFATPLGLRQS